MSTVIILGLIGIGLVTGVLTGLTGASGMSMLISGLMLAGLDIREIIAITFVVTLVNGVSASIPYLRGGFVDRRLVLMIGGSAVLGVYPGYLLNSLVSAEQLKGIVGVALLIAGIKLLCHPEAPSGSDQFPPSPPRWGLEILLGILCGVIMGILGGGGGFFIAVGMMVILSVPPKRAVATSILIMTLAAVPGFLIHGMSGTIPWDIVVVILPVSMISAFVTAKIGRQIPERNVKRLLGIYLVTIVTILLIKEVVA